MGGIEVTNAGCNFLWSDGQLRGLALAHWFQGGEIRAPGARACLLH